MKQINTGWVSACGLSIALLAGLAGWSERSVAAPVSGVAQTRFPGQVTAGGGTSGEVIARAGGGNSGAYMGGTPGIPKGSGGSTGGTATGGTVQQQSPGSTGSIPPPGGPSSPK